jgi:hypothetical protein
MSTTLPPTRQPRDTTKTRLLAVVALAAIGLALLILTPGHRSTAPTAAGTAHEAALTAQTPAPAGCFRDPATHALSCYHAPPAPTATAAPAGYFRDPTTHKLLRVPAHKPAAHLPADHSRGRIIP